MQLKTKVSIIFILTWSIGFVNLILNGVTFTLLYINIGLAEVTVVMYTIVIILQYF